MKKYSNFVVTEKNNYSITNNYLQFYYLKQVNKQEFKFIHYMLINTIKTIGIFMKEKSDIVISTGDLATILMCILAKLFRKK